MCCCHNQGEGHRCPDAWQLIAAAQQASSARRHPDVLALRRAYTQHLQAAGLLSLAGEAWPDRCTITLADDPRCPACAPREASARQEPRKQDVRMDGPWDRGYNERRVDAEEKRSAPMRTKTRATIEDLSHVEGKAELVNGAIILLSPTGRKPGRTGGKIYRRLADYEERRGGGAAFPDNVGFVVHLPHRESFSPDAAWYVGPDSGMDFPDGAPVFAVEVRSKTDYGPAAERAMREKRADYFACGTLVVWDVDVLGEDVIKSYKASAPETPVIFRRRDLADAEPAVPGWRLAVDDLFG